MAAITTHTKTTVRFHRATREDQVRHRFYPGGFRAFALHVVEAEKHIAIEMLAQ